MFYLYVYFNKKTNSIIMRLDYKFFTFQVKFLAHLHSYENTLLYAFLKCKHYMWASQLLKLISKPGTHSGDNDQS